MQAVIRTFTLLGLCLFLALPAFADAAPDKAGLVAAWEKGLKHDPHVSRFEKTRDADVYEFTTDFFPYKGRLRLLNAVVARTNESYLDGLYSGIIEVELMDAPVDFLKKYAASYGAWVQQNYFYYDMQQGVWFPASELSAHSASVYKKSMSASGERCIVNSVLNGLVTWGPILFLLAVLVLAVRAARKQNNRVWDSHAKVLEGQKKSLEMAEENLKLQREHTQLLRDIAAALKK